MREETCRRNETFFEALKRAKAATEPLPEIKLLSEESDRYSFLIRLCYELQRLTEPEPFILRSKDLQLACQARFWHDIVWCTQLLELEEFIKCVEPRHGNRPAKYQYIGHLKSRALTCLEMTQKISEWHCAKQRGAL